MTTDHTKPSSGFYKDLAYEEQLHFLDKINEQILEEKELQDKVLKT